MAHWSVASESQGHVGLAIDPVESGRQGGKLRRSSTSKKSKGKISRHAIDRQSNGKKNRRASDAKNPKQRPEQHQQQQQQHHRHQQATMGAGGEATVMSMSVAPPPSSRPPPHPTTTMEQQQQPQYQQPARQKWQPIIPTIQPLVRPLKKSPPTSSGGTQSSKKSEGLISLYKPPPNLFPIMKKFKRQRGYIDSETEDDGTTPTRSNVGASPPRKDPRHRGQHQQYQQQPMGQYQHHQSMGVQQQQQPIGVMASGTAVGTSIPPVGMNQDISPHTFTTHSLSPSSGHTYSESSDDDDSTSQGESEPQGPLINTYSKDTRSLISDFTDHDFSMPGTVQGNIQQQAGGNIIYYDPPADSLRHNHQQQYEQHHPQQYHQQQHRQPQPQQVHTTPSYANTVATTTSKHPLDKTTHTLTSLATTVFTRRTNASRAGGGTNDKPSRLLTPRGWKQQQNDKQIPKTPSDEKPNADKLRMSIPSKQHELDQANHTLASLSTYDPTTVFTSGDGTTTELTSRHGSRSFVSTKSGKSGKSEETLKTTNSRMVAAGHVVPEQNYAAIQNVQQQPVMYTYAVSQPPPHHRQDSDHQVERYVNQQQLERQALITRPQQQQYQQLTKPAVEKPGTTTTTTMVYENGRRHKSKPSRDEQEKLYTPSHTKSHPYLLLFLTSMICIASLSVASPAEVRTPAEIAALGFIGISAILALITALALRYGPSRRALVKPITMHVSSLGTLEFKSLACMATLFFLTIWTCIGVIVLFVPGEEIAVAGQVMIWNANLFFGTWTSYGVTSYLFASGCVLCASSAAENEREYVRKMASSNPKVRVRNDIARGWILLFIFSVLLAAFSMSLLVGPICTSDMGVEEETKMCSRLPFGIVFGVMGGLLAGIYWMVRLLQMYTSPNRGSSREQNRFLVDSSVDRLSTGLITLGCCAFAVNAGLLTTPSSIGTEPANIYLCSWVCFGISLYLLFRHVEIWSAQPWIQMEVRVEEDVDSSPPTTPVQQTNVEHMQAQYIPLEYHKASTPQLQAATTEEEDSSESSTYSSSSSSSESSSYSFSYDEETGMTTESSSSTSSETSNSNPSTKSASDYTGPDTLSGGNTTTSPSLSDESEPTPPHGTYQPYQQYGGLPPPPPAPAQPRFGYQHYGRQRVTPPFPAPLEAGPPIAEEQPQRPDPDMKSYHGRTHHHKDPTARANVSARGQDPISGSSQQPVVHVKEPAVHAQRAVPARNQQPPTRKQQPPPQQRPSSRDRQQRAVSERPSSRDRQQQAAQEQPPSRDRQAAQEPPSSKDRQHQTARERPLSRDRQQKVGGERPQQQASRDQKPHHREPSRKVEQPKGHSFQNSEKRERMPKPAPSSDNPKHDKPRPAETSSKQSSKNSRRLSQLEPEGSTSTVSGARSLASDATSIQPPATSVQPPGTTQPKVLRRQSTKDTITGIRLAEALQREEEELLKRMQASSFHDQQQRRKKERTRMSLFKDPTSAQAAETVQKQRAERKARQPLPSLESSKSSSKAASSRAQHQEASLRSSMGESSSILDSISLSLDSSGHGRPRHIRTTTRSSQESAGTVSPLPGISENNLSSYVPWKGGIPVIPDISGPETSSSPDDAKTQSPHAPIVLVAPSPAKSTATMPPSPKPRGSMHSGSGKSGSAKSGGSSRRKKGISVPSLHSAATLRRSAGERDEMVESVSESTSTSSASSLGPSTEASNATSQGPASTVATETPSHGPLTLTPSPDEDDDDGTEVLAPNNMGQRPSEDLPPSVNAALAAASQMKMQEQILLADSFPSMTSRARSRSSSRSSRSRARSQKKTPPEQLATSPPHKQGHIFEQFDTNNDGVIDRDEMREMFRQKLGKELTDAEAEKVFSILDKDKSGTVEIAEFEDWWLKNFTKPPMARKKADEPRSSSSTRSSSAPRTSSRRKSVKTPTESEQTEPAVPTIDPESNDKVSPLSDLSDSPTGRKSSSSGSPRTSSIKTTTSSSSEGGMKRSRSETALSKASPKDNVSIVSSQTIPNDLKISVDQMVAAALKQAQDLKQTHDALQSSPETSDESPKTNQDSPDSGFASSPIKSGSESGKKSSPSSGEQSSGSAEGRTASLNSGDAIVDEMVVEALKYAQDAKENSGHSAATTGNIPSFHSTTTGQSGGGASVHSYYSDHENYGETAPWYAC